MADTISPASMMAFTQGPEDFHPPQATVSLSETSLENGPVPATPESIYIKDEEDQENQEERKPTKKRKSWGQELPTPKTNLPPRKRAKTEDEKEQRRIERVLRNRQAAQSSRERKRQEVEKLEGEKSAIERQNESLKERLMAVEHEKFLLAQKVAKMTAQMKVFRQESGTSSPEPSSPAMEQFDHQKIKQELDNEYPFVPTPELSYSAASFASPSTMTYSPSQSPPNVGLGLDDSLTTSPDMTQHPAAMLCDLQSYDSRHTTNNCDPIIFASTDLSDGDLGSLLATDGSIGDDLRLFDDGFTAGNPFDDSINIKDNIAISGDAFTFDSLVDLDADHSHINTTNNTDDFQADHDSNDYLNGSLFEIADSSAPNTAMSSAQQPLLGAPA